MPRITATTHLVPVCLSSIARNRPCATVIIANATPIPSKEVAAGSWDAGFIWYCWQQYPRTSWQWCTFSDVHPNVVQCITLFHNWQWKWCIDRNIGRVGSTRTWDMVTDARTYSTRSTTMKVTDASHCIISHHFPRSTSIHIPCGCWSDESARHTPFIIIIVLCHISQWQWKTLV